MQTGRLDGSPQKGTGQEIAGLYYSRGGGMGVINFIRCKTDELHYVGTGLATNCISTIEATLSFKVASSAKYPDLIKVALLLELS